MLLFAADDIVCERITILRGGRVRRSTLSCSALARQQLVVLKDSTSTKDNASQGNCIITTSLERHYWFQSMGTCVDARGSSSKVQRQGYGSIRLWGLILAQRSSIVVGMHQAPGYSTAVTWNG